MGEWKFENEEERHKAEGAVSSVKSRIVNTYGSRGFLRFYDRAKELLEKLYAEFPEARNIKVRSQDEREEVLTKLLKVMYLRYGRTNFGKKAVEWLRKHGEDIPDIPFRIASEEELRYEKQLYEKVANWILAKEGITGDYEVVIGRLIAPVKYGNPDVAIVKKVGGKIAEIIVAEVKNSSDIRNVFEGFGQACAYKLFSHMQYLVIPKLEDKKALIRLKRLCSKVQVKLATFTGDKLNNLKFELEEGAKGEPPDLEAMEEFLNGLKVKH